MNTIETTIYVVTSLALCVGGLYYTLSGIDPQGCAWSTLGLLVVGAIALARMLWTGTAHNREMKRIRKEINKTKW